MARTVISIMCARYVVKAGNGVRWFSTRVFSSKVEDDATGDELEGKGVPSSRRGMRSMTRHDGRQSKSDNRYGESAKSVIDRSNGITSTSHEQTKFGLTSRVRRAEWRKMEAWAELVSAQRVEIALCCTCQGY